MNENIFVLKLIEIASHYGIFIVYNGGKLICYGTKNKKKISEFLWMVDRLAIENDYSLEIEIK